MKPHHQGTKNIYTDKNFYIIVSITLISVMAVTSINPVLPNLAIAFKLSPQQVGMAMTAFLLPQGLATPILSILADRFGRKQILIPSLILFAIAGAIASFTNDFRTFLECRFLQGLGAASLESLQLTLVGDLYMGKMLTSAMALNATMIGVSSTIFPLIGGGLGAISWRYPFLLSLLALPVVLLILTALKLPKQQTANKDFNTKQYIKNIWQCMNNRIVLGLLFVVAAIFILEFGICYTYIPIYAATNLHANSETIGIILSIESLALGVSCQLPVIAKKLSEKSIIQISFILCTIGLGSIPFVNNIWLLLIPCILFGAGQGMATPMIQSMLARLSPEEYRAGFMAINITTQSLGRAFGPVLAVISFGLWGMDGVFYASSIFSLVTLAIFCFVMTGKVDKNYSLKAREYAQL